MYQEREPLIRGKNIGDEPPEIRSGFVQKVYAILCAQLLLTALVASPFVTNPACIAFVKHHGFPLVIAVSVLNIAFLFCMICPCGCQDNMRKVPLNYALLGGFTITEGILVGVVCAFYTMASVLWAVVATGVLVGGLTIYAMTTETDFTDMGGYLLCGLLVLFIFGIFVMFFPGPIMHKIYCCLGILLFSFFLIYDTQMILGGGEIQLGVDDYVFGALQLYIDIIQLFLFLLQLFGDRR